MEKPGRHAVPVFVFIVTHTVHIPFAGGPCLGKPLGEEVRHPGNADGPERDGQPKKGVGSPQFPGPTFKDVPPLFKGKT